MILTLLSLEADDVVRIYRNLRGRAPSSIPDDYLFRLLMKTLTEFTEEDAARLTPIQDRLCNRCGGCCTKSGYIVMNLEEFQAITEYLNTGADRLMKKVKAETEEDDVMVSGSPCPFYDAKARRCRVYPVRPSVCRGFPLRQMVKRRRRGGMPLLSFYRAADDLIVALCLMKCGVYDGKPGEKTAFSATSIEAHTHDYVSGKN